MLILPALLALASSGGQAAKSYPPVDRASWIPDAMAWDASPVDLSYLNHKPAGRHGFVRAKGDRLVFSDGTPIRFWGGNLAAYALFSDKEALRRQARRIAQMGFNLMRIHHHDSMGWVSPTVIDKNRDDSRHFDREGLDKIDWLVKCLKDEGVYVWLDLNVGRKLKPGDQVGSGYDEVAAAGGEVKGFNYLNPRVQELMWEFDRNYLNHVNPYTKLAYKDDAAIMGLLVTNENDVTHHFGNMFLPDK
jgi:hypothetical protein